MTATLITQRQTSVRGFKNRFINGCMRLDQRDNFAAKNISWSTITYVTDRWMAYITGGNEGSLPSGQNMKNGTYQITAVTGTTCIDFIQRIEANNIKDLVGRTVTISFYYKNTYKTTVYWTLDRANSVDGCNTTGITAIAAGQINGITDTLTRYSIQVTLPAEAANGIQFYIYTTNQTYGYFTAGNFQLEDGPGMTDFEFRPYQIELTMCQYYCRWIPFNITFWSYGIYEALEVPVTWPRMRATPTFAGFVTDPYGSPDQLNVAGSGFIRITPDGGAIYLQAATAGQCLGLYYRGLITAEL